MIRARPLPRALIVSLMFGIPAVGMVAQSNPTTAAQRFEVVSIKRAEPNADPRTSSAGLQPGGRFVITNGPVRILINMAYPSQMGEILNAPDWVTRENYDVVALARPDTSRDALAEMIRGLLADRFKLLVHLEQAERPAYRLRLAARDRRFGPSLQKSDVDCAARIAAALRGEGPAFRPPSPTGPVDPCTTRNLPGELTSASTTMAALGVNLSGILRRAVIDETHLDGYYDVSLKFADDRFNATQTNDAPSLSVALREQLGLALESTTIMVQVVVVDKIERPSEN